MKITPYLLHLNGFRGDRYSKSWLRQTKSLFSDSKIQMILEPAYYEGAWQVSYTTPYVSCVFYVNKFQDLMEFSEVMARNRQGYTDVDPIEICVPAIYTENGWERGDLDQKKYNHLKYEYED